LLAICIYWIYNDIILKIRNGMKMAKAMIKIEDNYDSNACDQYMRDFFPRMVQKTAHMEYKVFDCDGFSAIENLEWVKECCEKEGFHVA